VATDQSSKDWSLEGFYNAAKSGWRKELQCQTFF